MPCCVGAALQKTEKALRLRSLEQEVARYAVALERSEKDVDGLRSELRAVSSEKDTTIESLRREVSTLTGSLQGVEGRLRERQDEAARLDAELKAFHVGGVSAVAVLEQEVERWKRMFRELQSKATATEAERDTAVDRLSEMKRAVTADSEASAAMRAQV